ncbi:MAG: DVU0298 family protein [Deltaproteobacteria bacterium]
MIKLKSLPDGEAFFADIEMVGRFFGKDILTKPMCPFCGMLIKKPDQVSFSEMPLGSCTCGAVYACDVTGHNLGTAMIEALVHACSGDWDCAWDLTPDEDYLDKQLKNYDFETHHIIHAGVYEGRRIAGVLYFIRLNKPVETKTPPLRSGTPVSPATEATPPKALRRASSKQEVEDLIKDYDLDHLLDMAAEDKRVLRDMKRLLYSADKLFRWRAAEALGRISAVIARRDPGAISKLLQALFTSISDTAASSWGSVDAIGEIISALPDHLSGFLPQLVQISRDPALLPEVLRAMGRIGENRPDLLRRFSYSMIPLLRNPDSEVRGYAAILLGHLRAFEARDDLTKLMKDMAPIDIYRAGRIEKTTIHQLATDSLAKL